MLRATFAPTTTSLCVRAQRSRRIGTVTMAKVKVGDLIPDVTLAEGEANYGKGTEARFEIIINYFNE